MSSYIGHYPTLYNAAGHAIGRAGDRLVSDHFVYYHKGTLNWDGRVWACSRKFNGIRLVSFEDFAGDQPVTNHGNIGLKSREKILSHYSMLESDGYNLLSKNCGHVDNYVRGLGYKSEQVNFVLGAAFLSLFLITATKR